jgi:hypothetical protein
MRIKLHPCIANLLITYIHKSYLCIQCSAVTRLASVPTSACYKNPLTCKAWHSVTPNPNIYKQAAWLCFYSSSETIGKYWKGNHVGLLIQTPTMLKFTSLNTKKYFWRIWSSRLQSRVINWKSPDVSEENISSIFRVEGYAKQEINKKEVASRNYSLFPAYFTLWP